MAKHRQLWLEDSVRTRLGEAYPWFLDKAEKRIAACTVCLGTGEVAREPRKTDLPTPYPQTTQNCPHCGSYVYKLEDFTRTFFARMPPAYRHLTLKSLQPYDGTAGVVSMEKQAAILKMLQDDPYSGWLFFGPPRAGKTTWTTALYAANLFRFFMGGDRATIKNKTAVWRVKAKTLLDQHTEWSIKRFDKVEDGAYPAEEPEVTMGKIIKYRRLGVKSKLYLEEVDKVNMTEARTATLFEIIDCLHEEEGTVTLNSNLTPEEFTQRFGEQFAWRLNEDNNVINLFEK